MCDVLWHLGLCAPADEACCDGFFHAPVVQAAYSVWQRNPQVIHFLRVWKRACEDFGVLLRAKWGGALALLAL